MLQMVVLLGVLFGLSISPAPPPSVNLMTFNIRFDNPKDGENKWDNRKSMVIDIINNYQPDIFGIQEGLNNQVIYLDQQLIQFNFVGVGRDDGKIKGEYSAIFYRKDRFKVIKSSTFWLSEKPDKPSKGWDAALERICTYALFRDTITLQKFWVFNTHFDHQGLKARENSSKLLLNKIGQLKKQDYFPVFLMGDFNTTFTTEPITILLQEFSDAKELCRGTILGPEGTFNGFKFNEPSTDRIDYIFVEKKGVDVIEYSVFNDSFDEKYPSDHFPVFVKVVFNSLNVND